MKCVSTDTPEQSLGAVSLQVSGSLFNFYFYDGDCLNSCSVRGMAGKSFVWSGSSSQEEMVSGDPTVKVQHREAWVQFLGLQAIF